MNAEDFEFEGPDGLAYENSKQYVWISILGFCGCYSDTLYYLVFDIFSKLYEAKKTQTYWYQKSEDMSQDTQDLQELILHIFDDKDLTEHGSSVRGSWLSDLGVSIFEKYIQNEATAISNKEEKNEN